MNWDLLTEGGYASILINAKKQIMKVMPKYIDENGEKYMNYHAMMELAVLCSYKDVINGIPQIIDYKVDDDSVSITMPYYGTTLNKVKIPHDKIPHVATKLLEILISLQENGIQHTDIKPCNILVSADFQQVTLIDFNIVSFELFTYRDTAWSKAYGTWNFCAPEVLLHTKPSSTSSVWSFGMILAYMYNRFPLQNIGTYDMKTLSSRSFWKRKMKEMHSKSPDGWLLPPDHVSVMPLKVVILFQKCMRWQSKERITLQDAYIELVGSHFADFKIKNVATYRQQEPCFKRLARACDQSNTSFVYQLVSNIYRQVHNKLHDTDTDMMFKCHILGLMILDMFDEFKDAVRDAWKLPYTEKDVWDLCECSKWDLLAKISKHDT